MKPAIYPLAFELGATGSADFTVSQDLPVDAAKVSFRKDRGAVVTFTVDCTVVGNVAHLQLTPAQIATLGVGIHSYQFDILSGGEPFRLAKGDVGVAFGTSTTFP